MSYDLILRHCKCYNPSNTDLPPQTLPIMDVGIWGQTIARIAPHLEGDAHQEVDLQGKFLSPAFVESHIHLDSALTAGEPRWNASGTLFEGIEIWRERKAALTIVEVRDRALQTLQQQAALGVLFVRTHVDVSDPKLTALKALLEVRDTVRRWLTLQIVAFPQDGVYGSPGQIAQLEESLKLGVDAVGGIPHYELTREDGVRSLEFIFDLAERYDRLIDVHCDEIDDDQSRFLEVVSALADRRSLGSRVTASHTTAFGSYNNAYALKLMGFLQRSGINIVSNPLINITLQGRTDTYPKRRGLTRLKELWQAGVNVSLGHDCIQDPWYSLGTGNMLDVAYMAAHVGQMMGVEELHVCYNMVTHQGAKTLNLEDSYGLMEGKPANLVVFEAEDVIDILRRRPAVDMVISQGNILR
jgi:cytosine deaminase